MSTLDSLFKSYTDFAKIWYISVLVLVLVLMLVFFLLVNSIKLFLSKLIKSTIIKNEKSIKR